MKKRILIGVCMTTLILLFLPTISAQQCKQVKDAVELEIEDQIYQIASLIEETDGSSDVVNKALERLVNDLNAMKDDIEMINDDSKPVCITFIFSTIISLLFALLGTIFGNIFGPMLATLIRIITAPAVFLAKIISSILNGNAVSPALNL